MSKDYERMKVSSSVVAIGYRTSKIEFEQYLLQKKIKEKYSIELAENQIFFPEGCSVNNINELLNNSPIITYFSKSHNYIITLVFPESKISIINNDFNENNNQEFEIFVKEVLDDNLSKIRALGINYNSTFKKSTKLKIFNKKIEKKDFFIRNTSFSITIPSDYDGNYVGTYIIEKVPQENENTTDERVYNFSANYNFDLSKYNALYKCKNIPEYIDNSSKSLFNLFIDTSDEFLSLDYDE